MNSYVFDKLPCGCEITAYEIGNDTVRATILNYGGIIQKLYYKGTDIIGGYDTLEGYQVSDGYQGALIGRVGNRIANGKFTLEGKEYSLYCNDGPNTLHGGNFFLLFQSVSPDVYFSHRSGRRSFVRASLCPFCHTWIFAWWT